MLNGRLVRAKVVVDRETAEFPERNSIKGFISVH
jgi:hypothetical protein